MARRGRSAPRWRWLAGLLLLAAVLAVVFEPELRRTLPSGQAPAAPGAYRHDRFGTRPVDQSRAFAAFVVSFDGGDDDDGDGVADTLGVPQWVAYELRRQEGPRHPGKRPSRWSSDAALVAQGLAPEDESYQYPAVFRTRHPDWYVRGHLAMKLHAERLGPDAGRETHTMLNAVPQRAEFNSGIWEDLECLTGAWADAYGRVWIVTGPVFDRRRPRAWLGETARGERRVAIPDALFKVVVRETADPARPAVLGLIYPQQDRSYASRPYPHSRFLASIDEIEAKTGLDLLSDLSVDAQRQLASVRATELWPVPSGARASGCGGP